MSYDWSQFTVNSVYRAPIEQVWRSWATPGGLESFFIRSAEVRSPTGDLRKPDEEVQVGDRYHWRFWHPFEHKGEILAVTSRESLTFSFGSMEVTVTVSPYEDATEVTLNQRGCRTDPEGMAHDHLNCRSCWVYFLTNLQSVITYGHDLRDPEAPAWADAISIHWNLDEGADEEYG